MAEVKRYTVVTQLNRMASIEKVFPMDGSAMFTEDIPNGVRKEAKVVMNKAGLLFTAGSTSAAFVMVCWVEITKYDSLVNQGRELGQRGEPIFVPL
jgi:ferritin-like metal-binding protein YciE